MTLPQHIFGRFGPDSTFHFTLDDKAAAELPIRFVWRSEIRVVESAQVTTICRHFAEAIDSFAQSVPILISVFSLVSKAVTEFDGCALYPLYTNGGVEPALQVLHCAAEGAAAGRIRLISHFSLCKFL